MTHRGEEARREPPPVESSRLVVLPDLAQAAAAAAERFARRCALAVAGRGECAIALAGGDTPRALYARLASEPLRSRIPWRQVRVFWGDERGVPPQDPRSNFRMAQDTGAIRTEHMYEMATSRPTWICQTLRLGSRRPP